MVRVEIGFKLSGTSGARGECIIAVDNFRLAKTTNLLTNPLFSADITANPWGSKDNPWVKSDNVTLISGNSAMGTTNYVNSEHNSGGTTIDAGFIEQTVTLPVGAYKLSVKTLVLNTIGCLYAKLKLGDEYKMQKTYVVQTEYWGDQDRELTFVVPAECEVTVGMSFDKVEGDTDPRYLGGNNIRFQADEFSLIRIGEVENTDISCQIANNDFSNGKNDAINKLYGWEIANNGFDKFSEYENGVAIRNDNTKGIQIAQVVSGLPNGWYKIEAQGFDKFTSQSSTLMFANGSYTNVASSKEVSGVTPASNPASAFSNYPSNYMNDLVVHVDDGQITLGVERDNTIGDSDFSAFNYFKLYYLYEESVFADVTNFIKNPSFETGSRLGWDSDMIETQASSASAGDSWDKNYYFVVDADKYIQQVVKGVPAGTYKLSAQIKADGGKDVTLSATVGTQVEDSITKSSSIEDIYVIFDVKDGEDITIKATSSGKFSIDNFRLKSAIEEVYLYNADAGMFFGEEKTTGYDIVKYERYPVGLSLNGTMLKMTEKGNDLYTFQNSEDKYIVVDKVRSRDDDYKYTFYSTDESHSEFKKTMLNSEACNLCINPADGRFGTNARTQNEGFASSYVKKYGTTYMGWSGEAGFDVVLPLIPEADKNDRGVNWQVLTKEQYETYGEIIKNAYSARMEAWPILCAARRSKMPVDYTELEYLYSKISSTGAAISKSAEAIRKQIMESGLYLDAATKDNSLDLTFLMPDADCKQKDVAWNNTDGLFKSCETTDYMAEGTFGGRYYKVQDIEGLQNTELSYEFTGLPEGRYVMSFKVLAYNVSGNTTNGVEVFAKTIDIDTITENVIANSYAIQRVYTPEFVVDENSTATVGIKLNGTNANLIAIDDVRILYYGKSESNIDTYKYKVTDGVVRFMGTWTNDDKAKDKMKKVLSTYKTANICTIDLAYVDSDNPENTFKPEFDITIDGTKFGNKNLLVYKKSSDSEYTSAKVKVTNANIVYGDECSNYTLVDGYRISIPRPFTADVASYSRSVKSNNGTLCLPFQFSSNDGTLLYSFEGFDEGRIARKEINGTVPACTPCIFRKAEGATGVKFSASNVTVSKDAPKTVESTDGYELRGVFVDKVFTESTSPKVNECLYIAQDKFWRGKGSLEMDAFRAYIYDGGKFSNVRSFAMFDYSDAEPESTSVENVDTDTDSEIVGYYNLNGQQIDKPASGVVIVKYSDGKYRKVMVR